MKKLIIFIGAIALVACGAMGTLLVQRSLGPTVTFSAEIIEQQLSTCSELATAKLSYHDVVTYEEGKYAYIDKKSFAMGYNAEVRAGIDLSLAEVEINGKEITVRLPEAEVLGVEVDPESLQFFDEKFAILKWQKRDDAAKALKLAQRDAMKKLDENEMLEMATEQSKALVETLLSTFTEGEDAYTLNVIIDPELKAKAEADAAAAEGSENADQAAADGKDDAASDVKNGDASAHADDKAA